MSCPWKKMRGGALGRHRQKSLAAIWPIQKWKCYRRTRKKGGQQKGEGHAEWGRGEGGWEE